MELKGQNQINLLNSQQSLTEDPLHTEASEFQSHLNQNFCNQLLNPEELKLKASALLNHTNNPEIENDFRRTCSLNHENSYSSPELNEAYQEYIKSYHKITSLYLIDFYIESDESLESEKSDDDTLNLRIYNTETEIEQVKVLDISKKIVNKAHLTQCPNCKLFSYGYINSNTGISLIIDNDYRMRRLPSGIPYWNSSAIYFERCVYCFGGCKIFYGCRLSSKFYLDKNRWIKLALMPETERLCSSLIINRNILISGLWRETIWLYSIDIDSFSSIPYKFERDKWKIAVNSEEKLYIIVCKGSIYESRVGDEYNWKWIAKSELNSATGIVYWAYNKGGIYIGCIDDEDEDVATNPEINYYKFNLDEKVLVKLSNPRKIT